uniref:Small ribosomal subunit protein uS3c n=1 Tax=Pseudochlorodesmis sp. HV01306a TaxID=2358488 RepID=A0A386AY01_9CHLO|nr:ribosomal protein S3 [Pseudochlorodesmis sp. HV01306a]
MGQKVHPIGFRLGITQTHLSNWFAQKTNYSKYLFEDNFLRQTLQKRYNQAGLEKIQILRKIENHLEVRIFAEKPDILIGNNGKDLTRFKQEIQQILEEYRKSKFFQTNFILPQELNEMQDNKKASKQLKKQLNKIKITLHILGGSSKSASALADFLIEMLEKRASYRFALNFLLKKKFQQKPHGTTPYGTKETTNAGIKIQISGRLNGAEIARREWIREGRLPLQTLQANIDYSFKKAYTIYGVLGVKVWIFNEKNRTD